MADKADTKTTAKPEAKNNKLKKAKDASTTSQSNSRPNSRALSRDTTPKFIDPKSSRESTPKPCTPKSSREGTPKPNTPRSSRGSTPKPSTPRPMPKYQYDKEELLKLRRSPLSKKLPVCLDKYKDILPDIILSEPLKNLDIQVRDTQTGNVTVIRFADAIDPEHWYKHVHVPRDEVRGGSPLTLSGLRPLERKPRPTDNDSLFKRKESCRDDEDGGGIVLGPQRKSFDTGCHVSMVGKQEGSRTGPRRIGSGRLALRSDSVDEERVGRRELPQLEELRKQAARGRRGGGERGYGTRREYDYHDDERDFVERRYERRREFRRYDSEPEEPEWFSAGPTSQMDTIELRGFEEPRREARQDETSRAEEEEEGSDEADQPTARHAENCVSVADRNGSLETNESSSPETSHEDYESKANTTAPDAARDSGPIQAGIAAQFDFNDLFNIDNIPGLSNLSVPETEMVTSVGVGGSRFSQWFQGSNTPVGSRGPASRSNSRRSSMTEEFSYLQELINGAKSPALASPEPDDPALRVSPHDAARALRASPADKRAHPAILQLLQDMERQQRTASQLSRGNQLYHAQQPGALPTQPKLLPQGALNVSDVEASIKSLLLAGAKRANPDSAHQTNIPHPVVPSGGHVLTAEELEANLTGRSQTISNTGPRDPPLSVTSDGDTQATSHVTSHHRYDGTLSKSTHSGVFGYTLPQGLAHQQTVSGAANSTVYTTEASPTVYSLSRASNSQPTSSLAGSHTIHKLLHASFDGTSHTTSAVSAAAPLPPTPPNGLSSVAPSHSSSFSPALSALPTALLGSYGNRVTTVAELELAADRQPTQSANDMEAFNRLLGMTKTAQHTPTASSQQQQQMLKQLVTPAAAPPSQPAALLTSQTAAIVAGQTAATLVSGAAGALVKSPIPAALSLQAPGSAQARAPSPLLPPTSPRAPSPIMFGSQPPMHLTAPSPIHAGGAHLPGSASPLALQVAPPARRVPSPQELHTHAQAIMQNALIKKQLEGQKQRFLQKQQNTNKSPSVEKSMVHGVQAKQQAPPMTTQTPHVTMHAAHVTSASESKAVSSHPHMTSTPAATIASLKPAFTPTSVIRKMASDKMEEKEKHADEDPNISTDKPAPVMKLVADSAVREARADGDGSTQDVHSGRSSAHSDSACNISITVPGVVQTPQIPADSRAPTELSRLQAQFHVTMEHVQSGKPVPGHVPAAIPTPSAPHVHKAPRPLVGQGAMNHAMAQPPLSAASQAQTPPQAMPAAQPISLQQLSSHSTPQAVAPPQQSLNSQAQVAATPQQLAQIQHQHMLATSQAMQHGAHLVGALSEALSSAAGVQGPTLASSQQGRPIKGVQSPAVSTISPPTQRPTAGIIPQSMRSDPLAQPALPTAHLPGPPMPAVAAGQGTPVASQRAIVGGGGVAGGKSSSQVAHDSVRLAEQARMAQIQAQLQAGAHISKGSPYALGVAGGRVPVQVAGLLPVQLTPQQQQQAAVANAILMQRMIVPSTPQGLHPQQLAALQAAQLCQQQQQRNYDSRGQQRTAYPPSSVPYTPPGTRGIHGQGAPTGQQGPHAVVGRSVSPQQQQQQQQAHMLASMHAKQESAAGRTRLGQGTDGLAKFFGKDLLKQQLRPMPALPSQGQRILTVEEIERRQQAVTN